MYLENVITAFQFDDRIQSRHVQPPRRYEVAFSLFFQDHGQPKWDAGWNLREERAVLCTGSKTPHSAQRFVPKNRKSIRFSKKQIEVTLRKLCAFSECVVDNLTVPPSRWTCSNSVRGQWKRKHGVQHSLTQIEQT